MDGNLGGWNRMIILLRERIILAKSKKQKSIYWHLFQKSSIDPLEVTWTVKGSSGPRLRDSSVTNEDRQWYMKGTVFFWNSCHIMVSLLVVKNTTQSVKIEYVHPNNHTYGFEDFVHIHAPPASRQVCPTSEIYQHTVNLTHTWYKFLLKPFEVVLRANGIPSGNPPWSHPLLCILPFWRLESGLLAVAILFFWSQKQQFFDKRVELGSSERWIWMRTWGQYAHPPIPAS